MEFENPSKLTWSLAKVLQIFINSHIEFDSWCQVTGHICFISGSGQALGISLNEKVFKTSNDSIRMTSNSFHISHKDSHRDGKKTKPKTVSLETDVNPRPKDNILQQQSEKDVEYSVTVASPMPKIVNVTSSNAVSPASKSPRKSSARKRLSQAIIENGNQSSANVTPASGTEFDSSPNKVDCFGQTVRCQISDIFQDKKFDFKNSNQISVGVEKEICQISNIYTLKTDMGDTDMEIDNVDSASPDNDDDCVILDDNIIPEFDVEDTKKIPPNKQGKGNSTNLNV